MKTGGSLVAILAAGGLLGWKNRSLRFALLAALLFGLGLSTERTIPLVMLKAVEAISVFRESDATATRPS